MFYPFMSWLRYIKPAQTGHASGYLLFYVIDTICIVEHSFTPIVDIPKSLCFMPCLGFCKLGWSPFSQSVAISAFHINPYRAREWNFISSLLIYQTCFLSAVAANAHDAELPDLVDTLEIPLPSLEDGGKLAVGPVAVSGATESVEVLVRSQL